MTGSTVKSKPMNGEKVERRRLLYHGIVQGVGFRPFIYRTAKMKDLAGFVLNSPEGVVVEIEGPVSRLDAFIATVRDCAPPLAEISGLAETAVPVHGDCDFAIVESENTGRAEVHISPDIATCPECLSELFNPADCRFRYPFINCTNCGPRLTIIAELPYDRVNTSMSAFPLCGDCLREYEDPADRRFHAEPNACPVCGPSLSLLDGGGRPVACADPVSAACGLLLDGKVLALKGIGGFHLAVNAKDSAAVKRLRSRKFREEKPLALMVRDLDEASRLADLDSREIGLLLSPQRPIVLVRKRQRTDVAPDVAPGLPNLGIMLPYSPLHHLLLEKLPVLVMTSGNQVDEPICIKDDEAVERLSGIADYFLVHDREILVRCDDSIAMFAAGSGRMLRRSRGFAPRPVFLKEKYPEVFAVGAQLKGVACILKGDTAFLSPHIGDLETPQAQDFFIESCELLKRIAQSDPEIIACDLHPDYFSTRYAARSGKKLARVQHHHAHIAACLAEFGISGKVIGLAMDGTGFGADATAWGGELLIADRASFDRAGHFRSFALPGADRAIKEPWRIAASLLKQAYGSDWKRIVAELELVPAEINIAAFEQILRKGLNSPLTSSLGRIFDGIAALLAGKKSVTFEGQAAMELEGSAFSDSTLELAFGIENSEELIIDPAPLVRSVVEYVLQGKEREDIAAAFHKAVIAALAGAAVHLRDRTGLSRVALGGGCFQNRILLEGCISALGRAGFEVFSPCALPCNDGAVSLGQAVIAGEWAKGKI